MQSRKHSPTSPHLKKNNTVSPQGGFVVFIFCYHFCYAQFHRVCIDSWLSRDHNVCPIDGQTVYSDVVRTPPNRGMNRATQNPRQRNLPVKKTSLSTLSKRQRTSHNQESTIPQDFSLYGSSLRQRYLYKTAVQSRLLRSIRPDRGWKIIPISGRILGI